MKKLIGIVAGDPNSINSEIIAKAWKKKAVNKNLSFFIIGNHNLIRKQFLKLKIKLPTVKIKNLKDHNFKKSLSIYDIPLKFKNPFKITEKSKSKYVIKSLNTGIDLSLQKKINGFINCPINKKEIFKNRNFGVTEFLGKKLRTSGKETMIIFNKKLSVSPITTHIKLKDVSKNISKNKIINKINVINKFFIKKFKVKPRIGVLGLNPHNFEFRKNSEEKRIIIPAIKYLKKRKILVDGPISADTAFINYKKNRYNIIVGMYHDQVLTPFKTLFGFDAINITVGIPITRVSPDHGTGKNIIRKNLANPQSLIESIKFFSSKNV